MSNLVRLDIFYLIFSKRICYNSFPLKEGIGFYYLYIVPFLGCWTVYNDIVKN